ncbi:hypothetical protein [Paenibacillus rhizovicinus]|uniref:hypothetical protein n=1 Tax=Paenibacillus rhizovicinus TaxID=2704463 RepID=UPI001CDC3E1B|nr:hypothetical protein [Paenibacillus rhizovicinus]
MPEAASEVIVLADQSKVGVKAFAKIIPIDKVDVVVSDVGCPEAWQAELAKSGLNSMS